VYGCDADADFASRGGPIREWNGEPLSDRLQALLDDLRGRNLLKCDAFENVKPLGKQGLVGKIFR
jgi:hypothetical protein